MIYVPRLQRGDDFVIRVGELMFKSPAEVIKRYVETKFELPYITDIAVPIGDTRFSIDYVGYTYIYGNKGGISDVDLEGILAVILLDAVKKKADPSLESYLSYRLITGPDLVGKHNLFEGILSYSAGQTLYGDPSTKDWMTPVGFSTDKIYLFNLSLDLDVGTYEIEPLELVVYDGVLSSPPDKQAISAVEELGNIFSDYKYIIVASQTMAFIAVDDRHGDGKMSRFALSKDDIKHLCSKEAQFKG